MTTTISEIFKNISDKQLLLFMMENIESNLSIICKTKQCILYILKMSKFNIKIIKIIVLINEISKFIDERESLLFVKNKDLPINKSRKNIIKYFEFKKKQNKLFEKLLGDIRDTVNDEYSSLKDINKLTIKFDEICNSIDKIDDLLQISV
jgi:hypothetical protein